MGVPDMKNLSLLRLLLLAITVGCLSVTEKPLHKTCQTTSTACSNVSDVIQEVGLKSLNDFCYMEIYLAVYCIKLALKGCQSYDDLMRLNGTAALLWKTCSSAKDMYRSISRFGHCVTALYDENNDLFSPMPHCYVDYLCLDMKDYRTDNNDETLSQFCVMKNWRMYKDQFNSSVTNKINPCMHDKTEDSLVGEIIRMYVPFECMRKSHMPAIYRNPEPIPAPHTHESPMNHPIASTTLSNLLDVFHSSLSPYNVSLPSPCTSSSMMTRMDSTSIILIIICALVQCGQEWLRSSSYWSTIGKICREKSKACFKSRFKSLCRIQQFATPVSVCASNMWFLSFIHSYQYFCRNAKMPQCHIDCSKCHFQGPHRTRILEFRI